MNASAQSNKQLPTQAVNEQIEDLSPINLHELAFVGGGAGVDTIG